MSYTYANRKRANVSAPKTETAPQPSMDALRSGAAMPTREQMGHRVDLPDAMRAKMENAFGADLSAVRLYESQTVADAGANAVAQGTNIAFAPGVLDFTSYGGQALLGHEISHVVSQARGEVTGNGFLNDHALEARADREGAMAASGQQVAMPTAAMSSVSAAPAAGPMQASKEDDKIAKHAKKRDKYAAKELSSDFDNPSILGPYYGWKVKREKSWMDHWANKKSKRLQKEELRRQRQLGGLRQPEERAKKKKGSEFYYSEHEDAELDL